MLCQAQSITLYLILRHSVAPLLYPPFLWGVIRHLASAVTTGDTWDVSDFPSWLDCGLLRCMCMCVKVTNGIWGNQVIKVIWGLTVSNISGLLKHLIERQLEVLTKGLIAKARYPHLKTSITLSTVHFVTFDEQPLKCVKNEREIKVQIKNVKGR